MNLPDYLGVVILIATVGAVLVAIGAKASARGDVIRQKYQDPTSWESRVDRRYSKGRRP